MKNVYRITVLATPLAILLVLAGGTARGHAESDPDCTPSAQRVIRDLQADGTFSHDQTMRDIMAYVIDKCSGRQSGGSEFTTVRGGPEQEAVLLLGSILGAVDRTTISVWDTTHDRERSEAAGEVNQTTL
jgi:hypothetical protein